MIKTIFRGIILGVILAVILSPITVHAETKQERWLRIQQESNREFMEGCEKDGNLTQEAVDALSWGDKSKKPNKKTKETNTSVNNNYGSSTSNPRGYVYGTDELHITGLPTDERGYTKAGDYGRIE
jgi:hypothetical protein